MINLIDWCIKEYKIKDNDEKYYLIWGYVSGHHRLKEGTYIHTSIIKKIEFDSDKDRFLIDTKSGSCYELLLSYIDFDNIEETKECLQKNSFTNFSLDKCKNLSKEKLSEIVSLLENGELYIEFIGIYARQAFFRNNLGEIIEMNIYYNIGMFQDSYLIKERREEIDFRYWDIQNGIEPYCCDGVHVIKIKNIGKIDIIFYGSKGNIRCKTNELTVIEI